MQVFAFMISFDGCQVKYFDLLGQKLQKFMINLTSLLQYIHALEQDLVAS